ncbi:hypothetical protein C1Y63_06255 [Corynebacterium sp. 13CS0277]|uniref:hypothetical protein n=1 Tax=Corynebacterium sp. 13CS0277 TaxID=2071994 RepID=UPI000D031F40|nr:hypothetical protein [Corynebacterium sp. 13CS0277]PRQ11448.1 hypothetical protein C1Y63_06255 [Corynebacterium sp. 13CS0277]
MKKISTLALATLTSVAAAAVITPHAGAAERVVRGPQWEDEPSVSLTDTTSPAVGAAEHIEVVILPQENPERATPTRVVRGPQWTEEAVAQATASAPAGGAQAVPETTTPAPAPVAAPSVTTNQAAAVAPTVVNAVVSQPAPAVSAPAPVVPAPSVTIEETVEAPAPAPAQTAPEKPARDDSDDTADRDARPTVAPAPAPAPAPVAHVEVPQLNAPAEGGNRATVTIAYPGGVAAANAVANDQGRVEVVTTYSQGGAAATDSWVSQSTHTTWNVNRNGHEVFNLTVPAGYEHIAEDLSVKAEAAGVNPFVQPYGRHALRVPGVNINGELTQA